MRGCNREIMFGGLVAFAVYRTFYLGLIWVEYNMEKVIFHYSRKEEYWFRWEEVPGSRVQVVRSGGGYVFYIQEEFKRDAERIFEQYQKYYQDTWKEQNTQNRKRE